MTAAELDELERLANAATPGPWKEFTANKGSDLSETFVHGPDKRWLARDFEPFNARFVAAAREAVPMLLAELRSLRFVRVEADAAWKRATASEQLGRDAERERRRDQERKVTTCEACNKRGDRVFQCQYCQGVDDERARIVAMLRKWDDEDGGCL